MSARPACLLAFAAIALVLPAGTTDADESPDPGEGIRLLSGNARIVHVLNRLGYGPRPGEVDRVRKMGLSNYIVLQLHPELVPDKECEARLAEFDLIRMTATEIAQEFPSPTPEQRKRLAELQRMVAKAEPEEKRKLQAEIRSISRRSDRYLPLAQLTRAKMIRAVYSERQLVQVLTDFWFNHFNVFGRKGPSAVMLPEYEERVIRPHVLGKFRDLVLATARSPAMLYYLDNWRSAAPPGAPVKVGPRRVRRKGGRRGLNENYARELLELHTLGVDGGYTQKDIIEVARCFTGWTIAGGPTKGTFQFRGDWHDAGSKKMLDLRVPGGGGISDGVKVIEYLCRHPSTARFIATKLCRRFVADDPPTALVDRCTQRFLETEGDIREVLGTLFTSEEFFSVGVAGSKIKKPHELVASAVRGLGIETDFPRNALRGLGQMGEPLYFCEPPTGFGDTLEKWNGANEILNRVNFALTIASGRLRGIQPNWSELLRGAPVADADSLIDWLCRKTMGRPLSPSTRMALDDSIREAREMLSRGQGRHASPREAAVFLTAAILGSPDFQMQ
jgi:uncharacterized protein (DUF1800 family)